jgi:hypothetical protein
MSFRNLIIFPKHLFNEWKTIVENEQRLSALDKKMKKIMNMRNISDDKKWILYKQQLTKALNIKNKPKQKHMKNERSKQIIRNEQRIKQQQNVSTFVPNPEEIFESDAMDVAEEEEEDNRFANIKFIPDETLEIALHEEAQRQLEAEHQQDVVRRDESLGQPYRVFEDRKTGSRVDIVKKLYNESDSDKETIIKPEIVKKSRTKKIYPQTYKYDTRLQLRESLKPKQFAEEQILRKIGTPSQFDWEGIK